MPETPSDAFVRTTLVHEDKKADLLLPSNLPVAELLPSIARRFLTVTPRRAIQGFVLTMSNGATIDPGLTFAAQGVKNGTLLILGPRVRETEKKYDDVIEAAADVVNAGKQEPDPSWMPDEVNDWWTALSPEYAALLQRQKDIHALFRNRNAVVTVTNGEELTRETLRLFGDAAERARLEAETLAIINYLNNDMIAFIVSF